MGSILLLVGILLMLVMVGMVFGVIAKLTTDFVVPIMFLRGSQCLAGWKELLELISANFASFVLYLLFQVVLGDGGPAYWCWLLSSPPAASPGCLLIIPYLGTVLLLPVLVFKRSYSLHYLAQYGREYDAFPPATAV